MFLCGLLLAGASSATAAVEFGIDASHRGPEIGKLHYGIFFEEINHAGDGGIYAELVRNYSFEDNTGNPDAWSKTSGVTWKLVKDNLLKQMEWAQATESPIFKDALHPISSVSLISSNSESYNLQNLI